MPGGQEVAPVDELTGLPLLIYTTRYDYYRNFRNFHHHFHPKNDKQLQGAFEGKPVRYARGQQVPKYLHDRYHNMFSGPTLPQTRKEKFTATVLALSGVLPREAIDVYAKGKYSLVGLNREEHRFLSSPRRLHLEVDPREPDRARERIGRFFGDYILEQALEEIITGERIDKFLHTKSQKEKRAVGREMLDTAVDSSVAELIPLHQQAEKEGMIAVGAVAVRQVVKSFFTRNMFYQRIEEISGAS